MTTSRCLAEAGYAAFLRACEWDVAVRKPGNVSVASPGHGMDAALFLASARAAAAALFERGSGVGARIEGAVAASRQAAGCNTNLGIVLLAAPIAAACERVDSAADLREAIDAVLAALDVDDARAAYRAIGEARPGGLGRVGAEDVNAAPSVDLRAAMALAADRDSIARQYTEGFADLFETGLAALGAPPVQAQAVQRVFLAFLARWPDSHIARKFNAGVAQRVTRVAQGWLKRASAGETLDANPEFAAWDEALKAGGINPGTSADLTVATLMLGTLLQGHGTR